MSRRHESTASRCSSESWIICRATDSRGAARWILLLTLPKLEATMSRTSSMSGEVRSLWPTPTMFSAATLCTSGWSKRPMAGHAGMPPFVVQESPRDGSAFAPNFRCSRRPPGGELCLLPRPPRAATAARHASGRHPRTTAAHNAGRREPDLRPSLPQDVHLWTAGSWWSSWGTRSSLSGFAATASSQPAAAVDDMAVGAAKGQG
mmetsp:Transcript_21231/g.66411  ORF Transcript_21231/g.66411 Transcript_21231/m.66411 type:complete len:205 (-) Transcript_21231:47-661(-)